MPHKANGTSPTVDKTENLPPILSGRYNTEAFILFAYFSSGELGSVINVYAEALFCSE